MSTTSRLMANFNICESPTCAFFASSQSFSRFSHFKIRGVESIGPGLDVPYSQRRYSMAKTRLPVCDSSSNVCSIYLRLWDIRKSREIRKLWSWTWRSRGKGIEKQDLRCLTRNIRYHIGDFFLNFSYLATYIYAKWCTHIHTQRKTGVMTYMQNLQAYLTKTRIIIITIILDLSVNIHVY